MAHQCGPRTVEHGTGCDDYEDAAAEYDRAWQAAIDATAAVADARRAERAAEAALDIARGKLRRFETAPGIPACPRKAGT